MNFVHNICTLRQIDWGDKTEFILGVTGSVKYNVDFRAAATSNDNIQTSQVLVSPYTCIPPITVGGYVTIHTKCSLESQVQGSVSFAGSLKATSSFEATKTVGGGYSTVASSNWVNLAGSTWSYSPPNFQNELTSGSAQLTFSLKPIATVTISVGFSIMSLNMDASVYIKARSPPSSHFAFLHFPLSLLSALSSSVTHLVLG